ncbi:unnamed protein product [Mesocestoides corti]|uniref:AP-3 complex subunit delta domain-containing protein n=1 Tax=Mesocestoides corti TaxID=53468 RepID=A0A0R3U6Y6_MESCO|nr:unnamed protein product [Mesocestoides corti]
MALSAVKSTLERALDKDLSDLVRGIRAHKDDERIGYLAASQSFGEHTDVLMLTTNLIRKDLNSGKLYDTSVALSGLSCFVTPDLARDLCDDVLALTMSPKPYIAKKAVLLLYKIFLKNPDALRTAFPRLRKKLEDPDPGVQSAAVNVICELARKNPQNYLSLSPVFFKLMTSSTNNWVLIKIIKLFGALTPLEPRLGKKLIEPLTNLIHNTSAMSLLYECINTVLAGESTVCSCFHRVRLLLSISSGVPDHHASIQLPRRPLAQQECCDWFICQGAMAATLNGSGKRDVPLCSIFFLLQLCVQKLRILIEDSDQNLKYLGLLAMNKILRHHPKSVQAHKDLILACLEDKDESIRLRALDLLHGMVTKTNLIEIVKSLVRHLNSPDIGNYFRSELISTIVRICSQENYHYVVSFEWYVSVLIELAQLNTNRTGELLANQLLDVAVRVASVRQFAVGQMAIFLRSCKSMMTHSNQASLHDVIYAAAWICGEYAGFLEEPRETLEAMLETASFIDLPGHIQSVLVLNCLKLYCKLVAAWFAQTTGGCDVLSDPPPPPPESIDASADLRALVDRLLELTAFLMDKISLFVHSANLEAQERVRGVLLFVSCNSAYRHSMILSVCVFFYDLVRVFPFLLPTVLDGQAIVQFMLIDLGCFHAGKAVSIHQLLHLVVKRLTKLRATASTSPLPQPPPPPPTSTCGGGGGGGGDEDVVDLLGIDADDSLDPLSAVRKTASAADDAPTPATGNHCLPFPPTSLHHPFNPPPQPRWFPLRVHAGLSAVISDTNKLIPSVADDDSSTLPTPQRHQHAEGSNHRSIPHPSATSLFDLSNCLPTWVFVLYGGKSSLAWICLLDSTQPPPSSDLLNGVHGVLVELGGLFAGEVHPVAAKAQRKVPLPEGLDLDAWINEPPPPPKLTLASPSSLLPTDAPLDRHKKRSKKGVIGESATGGIFSGLVEPEGPKPVKLTQAELDEMRKQRLLLQESNPHYLKSTKKRSQGSVSEEPEAPPVVEAPSTDVPKSKLALIALLTVLTSTPKLASSDKFAMEMQKQLKEIGRQKAKTPTGCIFLLHGYSTRGKARKGQRPRKERVPVPEESEEAVDFPTSVPVSTVVDLPEPPNRLPCRLQGVTPNDVDSPDEESELDPNDPHRLLNIQLDIPSMEEATLDTPSRPSTDTKKTLQTRNKKKKASKVNGTSGVGGAQARKEPSRRHVQSNDQRGEIKQPRSDQPPVISEEAFVDLLSNFKAVTAARAKVRCPATAEALSAGNSHLLEPTFVSLLGALSKAASLSVVERVGTSASVYAEVATTPVCVLIKLSTSTGSVSIEAKSEDETASTDLVQRVKTLVKGFRPAE